MNKSKSNFHSYSLIATLLIVTLVICVLGYDLFEAIDSPVFSLRIKRFLLSGIAGASLALAGAIFQLLLSNPLADPYIIGVSGGATLGAVFAFILFSQFYFMTPIFSFIGALLFSGFMLYYGYKKYSFSGHSLLLIGVIANAIASAIISFAKGLLSPNKNQEILFWLMGYIWYEDWLIISLLAFILFVCVCFSISLGSLSDATILGEDVAHSLGVNHKKLKRMLFIIASVLVGSIIPFTGMIGFVGLIVPHFSRILVRNSHQKLFLFSATIGFFFLAICDLLSKKIGLWLNSEPPVGAVTAIIGGPVFIYMLLKTRSPNRENL